MVAWSRLFGGRQLPRRFQVWRQYLKGGVPEYLARHYWWAYLSRGAVLIFDHPVIISTILFGQYRVLMNAVLRRLNNHSCGRFLQLTSVYGELIPSLHAQLDVSSFHITDISPVQLQAVRSKIDHQTKSNSGRSRPCLVRSNVEQLPYPDDSFDTLVIFFLLHELPAEPRQRVLREALRVLKLGGRLVVVEYGEITVPHWFHRNPLMRWGLEFIEPYLGEFWRDPLRPRLNGCATHAGKRFSSVTEEHIFGGFYRLLDLRCGLERRGRSHRQTPAR